MINFQGQRRDLPQERCSDLRTKGQLYLLLRVSHHTVDLENTKSVVCSWSWELVPKEVSHSFSRSCPGLGVGGEMLRGAWTRRDMSFPPLAGSWLHPFNLTWDMGLFPAFWLRLKHGFFCGLPLTSFQTRITQTSSSGSPPCQSQVLGFLSLHDCVSQIPN